MPSSLFRVQVRHHLLFCLASLLTLLAMFSLLRGLLLAYNHELAGATPAATLAQAFVNGLRFDLQVAVYVCLPLLLALLAQGAMQARALLRAWLTAFAGLALLLGVIELDFYREFHQRLNGLVFQYLKEDPGTVLSMIWYGFPVARLVALWVLATALMALAFRSIDRRTRARAAAPAPLPWLARAGVFVLCFALAAVAARGTLRQGPPLRWGDAYTTDSTFANQLGLNGAAMLFHAARHQFSDHRDNVWKATLPPDRAAGQVRELLVGAGDKLVDADSAAVRRDFSPPAAATLRVRHVVVILMESFAGRYVGALGSAEGITPHFDRLAREGLLFTRFFSNGTHTHQGMFATMACFPNLPGFEYLMQTPEGGNRFSGLPQLLGPRGYDNLYVYNGDFAWDNQAGFFGNQGMTNFIGRRDYVNPAYSDPTWGVSDQDMFARAALELKSRYDGEPFYALLQTLSNHAPYALPEPLPVARVTGHGSLDEHLTAMRYADWALGRFFDEVRAAPWFGETLFVIVGDHGFGTRTQLTEMDLHRFHVPLLMIAPGIRERFGAVRDTVGTQLDVVPTIMGRLGGEVRHQCWGRDLLTLPEDDAGFGVIKPSGTDQTVAIVSGDRLLIKPRDMEPTLYSYRLGASPASARVSDRALAARLETRLDAFLQTATRSLLDNSAGATAGKTR